MSPVSAVDVTVPYGRARRESDRFSDPELIEPSRTNKIRSVKPRAFPQLPSSLSGLVGRGNEEVPQAEDAFQLRIQSPKDADGLPVVVFIPGGAFISGTSNVRWFSDSPLVRRERCVLVTVNYRIGILGHLDDQPSIAGSQRGLRDLTLALTWVRRNIRRLGGDPENITLAGDSAGAWYAYALSIMEETRGLFRRTALISLPHFPPFTYESLAERWTVARASLPADSTFSDAPVSDLLRAQQSITRSFAGEGLPLMPAAGGEIPTDILRYSRSSSRLHIQELALLNTTEESAAFVMDDPESSFRAADCVRFLEQHFANPTHVETWVKNKRPASNSKLRMIDLMTLYQFALSNLELANAAADAGVKVHLAQFSLRSNLPGVGSPHCMPLPFLLGLRANWGDAPMLLGLSDTIFDLTSQAIGSWFAGFARIGAPDVGDLPYSPHNRESTQRVEFDGGIPRLSEITERDLQAIR